MEDGIGGSLWSYPASVSLTASDSSVNLVTLTDYLYPESGRDPEGATAGLKLLLTRHETSPRGREGTAALLCKDRLKLLNQ